jgi:DNA-binding response OmpR family regulator
VGDVEEGFAHKADDYVVKPFQPRALKAKVEGLLAGGTGAKPA